MRAPTPTAAAAKALRIASLNPTQRASFRGRNAHFVSALALSPATGVVAALAERAPSALIS